MRRSHFWRTLVAMLLAVGLPAASIPVPAASGATLHGSVVVGSVEPVPLAGAVVHLADAESGAIVASAPTDASGLFEAPGLAPATYRLGIESAGRLYAVASPVTLAPGQAQTVTVAVPGNAQATATPEDEDSKKGGLTWWNNPLTASLIIVAGAVVLGLIIDKATDEKKPTPPSPSAPQG